MRVGPVEPAPTPGLDLVVLLDEDARPIGQADRTAVHTTATPLHLAFSTYLFNARGEVLLTRRALGKKTWPGVWTNSCCGHPRPGEAIEDAARRRIEQELGLTVGSLSMLVPDFRYRATDASGVVENEVCPVMAGFVTDDDPRPDPDEVSEWAWVPWREMVTAIAATPQVYSPWSVLQVPRLAALLPSVPSPASTEAGGPLQAIADVDALLAGHLAALRAEWYGYTEGLGVDVLPRDLPDWLADLIVGQGKRLRVTMAYWGFVAAGGVPGSGSYQDLVTAAAALEALHLFALIHDDIMDGSSSRRGRPSAHVQATAWHRAAQGLGAEEHFGANLAMLLGDLAHTVADRLADLLPRAMRQAWYALSIELIAGQRADLTGAAAGRRDRTHAEHVARVKSGRYTVARPLQMGALAAHGSDEVLDALAACGDHLGHAFALRDDYLGVWGDPAETGKPSGDDLFEAKATMLLTLAQERLGPEDSEVLGRLGEPTFRREDVPALADAMRACGVDAEVERLIEESVARGMACLDAPQLHEAGVTGIRDAARMIAWRNS